MAVQTRKVSEFVEAFDAHLLTCPDINVIDRVESNLFHPKCVSHKGVGWVLTSTRIVNRFKGRDHAHVSDSLQVTGIYRMTQDQQKQTYYDALCWGELLRECLLEPNWFQDICIEFRHVSTRYRIERIAGRGIPSAELRGGVGGGWAIIQMEFEGLRLEAV